MKKDRSSPQFRLLPMVLILSGLSLVLFATLPRLIDFLHYKQMQSLYNNLTSHPTLAAHVSPSPSSTSWDTPLPTPSLTPTAEILAQYAPLLEINPEVVGWITIDNTSINYPLMQHDDNEYYLLHDPSNTSSIYGSIYIDYRNHPSIQNQNTLIYGHNMNDGSMFHELLKFKDETFFTSHPYLYISNLYERFTYEVFSVYVVDADVESIAPSFPSDEAFLSYLNSCMARSLYPSNISFNPTDEIVTLVTCSYELPNARTIVQARRVTDY